MKEMPEGYTMLDCLTTQSGAYVDTGVPASKTLRAEMDFAPLEYTGEVSLGMKTQSDEVDWRFFNYQGGFIFDCGAVRVGQQSSGKLTNGRRYAVSVGCTNNTVYATVVSSDAGEKYEYHTPFEGSVLSGQNVKACASAMRLYSLMLYEGDSCVRAFVPCMDDKGRRGLYDIMNGEFHPVVNDVELPVGWIRADFAEASNNAYIDTEYVPTVDTSIVADIVPLARSTAWGVFFGVTGNDSCKDGILLRYYNDTNDINGWFCNDSPGETQVAGFANKRITAELKVGSLAINGTSYPLSLTGVPYDGPIYLFCGNNGGTAWRHQSMRLYSFKIYENGVLVRNFVPCYADNGNANGNYSDTSGFDGARLYDTVEGKFYDAGGTYNSENSSFKAGHDSVQYLEWNEKKGEFSESVRKAKDGDVIYRVMTSGMTQLSGGQWYVVKGNVKLTHGLTVGNPSESRVDRVYLILTDGSRLEVQGEAYKAGILVKGTGQDDELHIYGQSKGTGTLIARGGENAAGIGGNDDDVIDNGDEDCGTINIHGGRIEAYGGVYAAGIGGGCADDGDDGDFGDDGDGDGGTVTIYGGDVTAMGGDGAAGIGPGKGGENESLTLPNAFRAWCGTDSQTAKRADYYNMTDRYVRLESTGPVTYMEWKDGEFVEKTRANYRFITSETTVLEDDVWYVVEGALKLNRGLTVGYPEKGDTDEVHLILTDGSRLEVQGADHYAGILVKGGTSSDDKLHVYGQAEGTGTLIARGGSYAAGIGGNDDDDGRPGNEDCGTVMIHGGKIEAYGGSGAAGIGGGYGDGDGDGGDVTIYGGDVTAVGDGFGAGIGGGYAGESGTLKLYGGNVTAIGGASAVGVGSGYSGDTPSKSDLTTERAFRIWAGASVEGAARQSEYDQTMRYVKFEEAEPLTLRFLSSDEELVLSNYYFFTEQTRELSGMGGFCVVEGEFDLHHGLVVGSGGPMLILADGSSLRVHGEYGKAGIRVEDGDVIFIFGQVEGSGRLYAEGGEGAAGIGGDSGMDGGDVYIEGGVIEAIGGIDAAGIGGGKGGEGNGKVNIALRADVTAIGGGTDGRAFGGGSGEEDEPMEVVLQDGAKVYASDTDESAAQFYTSFQPTAHYERIISGIQYMAWDDSEKRLVERFCSEYEVFTPDMTELKSGKWYLVTGTNVLDHGLLIGSSAYIILEDGCRLELHGEKSGQPGIDVERGLVDDRLHIYGQKDGTGQLLAWGGEECAGIGGRAESLFGSSCGEIYIHGGHIEAYGGSNGAAGIGGGARETPIYPLAPFLDTRHSNFFLGGDGPKKLNIYGGEIFAYAGDIDGYENYFAAAGIGGGGRYSNDFAGGNGGTINIFGGLVVAEGGPGIGPGRSGPNLEAAAKRIYDSGDSSMELWIGGGRVIGMIEYAQNENGVLKKDSVKVDSEFYSIWSDETHLMESVQHRVRATISCEDVGTRWNPWKIGTTPQAGKEGVTFGDIWAYLEDGQLTCVGQGTISAQAFAAIGSARSSVKSLVISNGIVAIENNAFAGIGTVAEPVELHLPSSWSVDDVPLFNTSWRGGFFFSKPFNLTVPCAAPIEITGVTIDGVTQDTLPAPGIPAVYTVYVGSSVTVQYSFSGQKYQRTLRIGPSGPDGAYVPVVEVDAKYVDADGYERQTTATLITESTRVLDDGRWYVTTGTIVNGAGLAVANGATANLILADGAALTAQGEWNRPGLRVERGAALNVYGQSGGRGALKATGGNGDVGVGIGGAVTVYGGIFWKDPKNWGTVARDFHVVENPDAETKGTYPWLVESSQTVHVEVGILEHMTAVWTSDDGETNAVENGSFEVPRGTTGVKVIFTPEDYYGLNKTEFVLSSPLNHSYTLTEDDLPTAEYIYVVVTVGKLPDHVVSAVWTSDNGETNAVKNGSFEVLRGTTGVKVIFTPEVHYGLDNAEFVLDSPLNADYTLTEDNLPTAEYRYVVVTVGKLEHMTAAWTSDNGETNKVVGDFFEVPKGTTGVKVIFTPEDYYMLNKTEYVFDGLVTSDCTIPADDLPTAEYLYAVVTVGELERMTAAWTSGDGRETNKVVNGSFEVLKGTTGVKVIFTPEDYYMLNKTEYVFDGLVTSDCTIPADDLPTAEYIYAVVTVGELERMTAVWTSDNGETNAIKNGSFEVLKGTTGVKVIFTPNVCYELQGNTEFALASPLNADYTMTEDDLPKAVYISFEVSYLVWDEAQKELKNATLVVNKEEMLVTPKTQKLEDRYWYVVSNEVECGTITVSGTANLVLTDGAKLTVNGGICVEGDNALNIYGQIKGTGELVANGNILCAGIGGNGGSCGTVTINGGTVTAQGGESGMGIGVGSKGAGGTVTINGGTVTAQGSTYCAGIGGGTVTINGGVVTAKGGSLAAGIGGNSVGSSVVHIMINGGLVMAEGGERGAGIGNGFNGTGADVTINETKVVVGAGSVGGPSVRLWERTLSRTVRFPVVNGLTVRATVGGIEHNVATEGGVNTVIVAVGDQLTLDFSPVGTTVTMQGENPVVVDVAKNMTLSLDDLPTAGGVGGVPYRDWTGSGFKDAVADAVALNSDASELLDGRWYVVTDEVECGAITVSGTANLILADGAKLTVKGGICVEGKNALNIYGQAEGTGELVANNSKSSAGIGGGWGGKGGIITINGGTVTAQGGVSGAGIGGGGNGGNGGTVTINGGTVTAQGGSSGAGIGGGMKGAGGTVTINGGTVTATGGTSSAGIGGGGNGVNGGDVTINGGMVTAQGGSSGAGIGGGLKGDGGTVMIYGGDVTAIGGMSGAGIGGGNGGNGGNVTINGGTVTATGGEWGAGIGGGAALSASVGYVGGAGGTVTINGGTVTAQGGKDAAGIGGGSESDSDGSVYRDEKKVSMVDGNVGKGYRYVKFVEIGLGPTCTGGDIAKEGGVWVVKPTGNATEVAITGLPTGDSVVVPPTVTKVTGADDDKIIVKSGANDITSAFTITSGAIALNPEGEVNGVPVKPIIGKLDGEDAPATQPFTLGEGDAAVTVATIPGLVYELKLTTDLGTAFGTIRDGVKATGDGKPVKLTDTDPPKVKAFYIIDVSAP